MNNSRTATHSVRRNLFFLLGFISIVFLVFFVLSSYLGGGGGPEKLQIFDVARRDLNLFVTERGIVRPARVTPIKSRLAGNQAKLIWVLDEGTQVNKGLLIARFDTKPFMDLLQKAEQELLDAEAQLESALKGLELLRETGKGKVEAARRKLEIETIKADDLKNGSGPLKRRQLKKKVHETIRNMTVAKQEYEDLKILLDKGHISQREYQKSENVYLSAVETAELAEAELQNFDTYEWPRIIREAEVITDAANQELARVNRTNEIEEQQQHAKIEKSRRVLNAKQAELKNAQREVAACDVYSQVDGILLYSELPSSEKKKKIQIGDSIWEGQTFLEIPDTNDLVVEIDIREIDVSKLTYGKEAEISLDAYPGNIYRGSLIEMDALAQQDMNNQYIRRFNAIIRFDRITPEIHVGMSASVNIIYERLEDIIAIPADAVSYKKNKPVVNKISEEGLKETPVELGKIGIQWLQVIKGLQENDQITTRTL